VHESSIALSLLAELEDVASRASRPVKAVEIIVGALNVIDTDALVNAFKAAARDAFPRIEVRIVREPARLRCRSCGHEWVMEPGDVEELVKNHPRLGTLLHLDADTALPYIKCPRCGSSEVEALAGARIRLGRVEFA